MTKKNKIFLAAAGAALLILLCCLLAFCGRQQDTQPTEPSAVQSTPCIFTVELCSDSGYPLEGVGIYVYTDATQQELVWFARTDAEGKITFRDVTCEGYIAVLDGVSSDYIVEETYPLTGEHTTIVVAAQMQSDVDLSAITRSLGEVMFDFTVTSSDGVEYTLSELLKEKDAVVLNFWYLNCGPCRQEFPYLQEAYEAYSDSIEILAMNPVDGTDEEITAFKKELELTFPMFQCDPDWAKAMQLTAYPTTVVIDRYGVISLIHKGSVTTTKVFTDTFAHFTAEDYVQGVVENIEDLETEVPGSNPDDPIELGGVQSFEVTIPAGMKLYYHLYRVNGYLTITNENIYAVYNNYTYEAKAGGIGFSIKSPDTYTPAVLTLGNDSTQEQTFTVKIAKAAGVVDNPYSAALDTEFTTKVASGNDQGVYYQVTAPSAGYLVFECLEATSGVKYDYLLQSMSTSAQRSISGDGNSEGTMVSLKVSAGEKVKCWIVAEKDAAGNKYPGGTFKSKLYMSDTPVTEETGAVEKIDYAVTVTDENRKPIANVSMNIDLGDSKPHVLTTDEKGVAHTKQEPGSYPVVLTLPAGYTAATTEFTLTEARPYASIKLDTLVVETATYTVTVTDESGAPVQGVSVMIGSHLATTDANGQAVFALPKGEYTATISNSDGSVQNKAFAEGETELTMILGQGGDDPGSETRIIYTVKVVDYSGNAQSGVTVQFLKNGSPVAVQTTDDTGRTSAELAEGDYTVALVASGLYYEESGAVLSASSPYLVLRVTQTKAENPKSYYFGTTYTANVGATYVTMTQTNVVTYFTFTPTQEGLYRITASDPNAEISYWGGSVHFVSKREINGGVPTNTFDVNVKESELGNTYIIGVEGVTDCILVIERTGSAELDETDIPWEVYEGNPPTKIYGSNPGQNLTYVDLTGKTSSFKAVLGSDGYYHLNSASGKLLYVNLGANARYISMYTMLGVSGVGGTKLGRTFYNSDGSVLKKEDYTECMIAYVNCRAPQSTTTTYAYEVYPLTEDLVYMLQNGGEYMGWWDETSANFLFAELGSKFNPELGWMFAVCY